MKTLLRILFFIVSASVLLSTFVGCKQEKSKEKFTQTYVDDYFNTTTTVIGYAESSGEFHEVVELIESRLSEYHKLYDAYHSVTDSGYEKEYAGITNIKDINAIVGGTHLVRRVDKKIIDMLLYAKETYTLTGGETNVAMGSVLKLWHDERENASKNPA